MSFRNSTLGGQASASEGSRPTALGEEPVIGKPVRTEIEINF